MTNKCYLFLMYTIILYTHTAHAMQQHNRDALTTSLIPFTSATCGYGNTPDNELKNILSTSKIQKQKKKDDWVRDRRCCYMNKREASCLVITCCYCIPLICAAKHCSFTGITSFWNSLDTESSLKLSIVGFVSTFMGCTVPGAVTCCCLESFFFTPPAELTHDEEITCDRITLELQHREQMAEKLRTNAEQERKALWRKFKYDTLCQMKKNQ